MEDSAKYLIHADVTASGVVEREDVVGAVYGQTEGLLGDELDLRYLQESSKVGRIDVDVESEGGRSFGELTIATSMDRVETAVLAASLETIGRVGPCRSEFRVTGIEDVRAAKRREVVDRAKELLAESFDETAASSQEILEEVRRAVRVEDITEYEGLPAGPNVASSDAIIVVEGRADVLQLLEYGVKNAVAVEGTDVPETVADLTRDRTVTAFLDGDRGGDLILKELVQVGDVDYVALAPPDRSVEDLARREVMAALRGKVPYEQLEEQGAEAAPVPTDGGTVPAVGASESPSGPGGERTGAEPAEGEPGATTADARSGAGQARADDGGAATAPDAEGIGGPDDGGPAVDVASDVDACTEQASGAAAASATDADGAGASEAEGEGAVERSGDEASVAEGVGDEAGAGEGAGQADGDAGPDRRPATLAEHVAAVVEGDTGTVRLLDEEFGVLGEAPAGEAFEAVEAADPVPSAVVLDDTLTQRLLDVAAQRGVGHVVARATGDLVKQPVGVRVRTADQLQ